MYNILVCDDDKEIVEAIEIYLTQEGYRILKAYDGTEALEMLEREEVHLLLLDVMMPKLDGIRATLKIREKNNLTVWRHLWRTFWWLWRFWWFWWRFTWRSPGKSWFGFACESKVEPERDRYRSRKEDQS